MLTAQCFFFLRDISHRHQHHNPASDTIVDLHEFDFCDDILWRNRTLYALYRKVITFKRIKGSDKFYNALGVLAYAESFSRISEEEITTRKTKLAKFYSEQIKKSIMASEDLVQKQRFMSQQGFSHLYTLFFAALAALFSFSFIYLTSLRSAQPPPAGSNPNLDPIISFVATTFLQQTTFAIIGLLTLIWMLIAFSGYFRYQKFSLFRNIARLTQPFRQGVSATAIFLISVVGSVAISYLVLWMYGYI